jgi:arylsulfatase A-like enzyme
MKWPGSIPPATRFQAPVITLDVFATIAAASQNSLPPGQVIDAVDLLPFIQADSLLPHPHLYWQRGNSRAIRSLDWKVIWNEAHSDTLIYHISRDREENHNLLASHRDLAIQLIRIHKDWSQHLPPPLWPSIVHFREEVDGRWFYFDN